ncbi:MAG: hypothetical protein U0457_15025 [Candidatus Sericytochromatia bacterium]
MKMFSNRPFINIILLNQDFSESEKIKDVLYNKNSINNIYTFRDGIEAIDITKNDLDIQKSKITYLVMIYLDTPYANEFLLHIKNNQDLNITPVIIIHDNTKKDEIDNAILPSNHYLILDDEFDKCIDIIESIENFTIVMNSMKDNISHKHLSYML